MDTQTQIDRLIELAIIQRSELKQLVEQLPQLREHLNAEVEKVFDETEPQLRAELEEWTTKQTADKTAALGVALEEKIADLAKSLEVSTQARYNAIIAERAENARLAAQAEAKIAEHAASLPSAVKEIVSAELARFPRAGEIDQLRKEFAEPRGLNPRGKWQAGETYNKLDLVTINGDSYTSNTDGNRTRPSRSSADWTLVAARGTGGGGGPTSLSELTTVPSDGDVLIGSGTSWVTSNLTAGAGISITVGPGAITISATDGDITLDDGTAASPSLHFTNDPDTGIYRPAANTLGISVSGTQVAYFDENGLTVPSAGVVAGGSIHAGNGNANNPSLSFDGDQDTGFFRHQPNEIGIALGGTQYATLTSTTFSITPVVTMASSLRVNGTTDSSSKDTGAIVTEGGLGVEKSATFGGNLTVSGTGTFSGAINANADGTNIVFKAFGTTPQSALWTNNDGTMTWGDYATGTKSIKLNTTNGNATLGGNLTVSGTGTSALTSSSSSLVVGSTTATSTNTVGVPQITAESDLYSSLGSIAHNNTNGNHGFLLVGKSRGTKASPTILADGDVFGELSFVAYDGAAYRTSGQIRSVIAGTPGASDLPTALDFRVAPDASATPATAMRIAPTGNLLLGTTTDSGNGKLQLATHSTSAGGIGLGTALSMYRSSDNSAWIDAASGNVQLVLGRAGTANLAVLSDGSNVYASAAQAGMGMILRTNGGTAALTLDSSQRCILSGALRLNNAYTAGAPTATGYVTLQDSAGNTYKVLVGT